MYRTVHRPATAATQLLLPNDKRQRDSLTVTEVRTRGMAELGRGWIAGAKG